MNILVTGGRGYLGGRLCEFLSEHTKHFVLCASRSRENHLGSAVKTVFSDWESEESLRACCKGVDVLVHLAAMNAAECAADPVAALSVNAVATARLLEAAKKEKVRRFVYLSTAHVYGSPLMGHISEETWPQPIHPYAASHRAAEDSIMAADHQGQIEGIVLRLSNAFGAPVDPTANCWDLLFNDLCRQAVMDKALVLRTSGLQRRNFVPLTDVCRAITHLAELPLESSTPRLFNVGGDWAPTVWEAATLIVDRIEARVGHRLPIKRTEPRDNEIAADLDYQIDLLTSSGYRLEADRVVELDALLAFCERHFGVAHE